MELMIELVKTPAFLSPPMPRILVALATASSSSSNSCTRAGLAAAASVVVCAIALVMCASHALRWPSRRHKNLGPVIQLDMDARIISTKRAQHALTTMDDDDGQGDVSGPQLCVWHKNILMGEKCQLPDFSGIIVYDSTGNLTPNAPPSRHTSSK